jgi:hypothetical protein
MQKQDNLYNLNNNNNEGSSENGNEPGTTGGFSIMPQLHGVNNNSIQFNSILIYLHANLTAQWPITK